MKNQKIKYGTLKKLEALTGIPPYTVSSYLSEKKDMSKKRAIELSEAGKQMGLNFSPADWMFQPQKIRKSLIEKERNSA